MTFDNLMQAATILGVVVSIYISLRKTSPEIRVTNADADQKKEESEKLKVETALLQDQRIANLQTDLAEACGELDSMKLEMRAMKDIQASKDREFLVLKQDLAGKNELLEKQQAELQEKNRLIEALLKTNEEQNILHRRWEIGIEILLQQMQKKDIIPLWYPTKKEN